jgi:protein SCO1
MTKLILIAAASLLLVSGCKKSEPQTGASSGGSPTAAPSTNRQVYKVRGVVKEFESPTRAKIAHEEIPGYMAAMTMPLDVKNANEFAGIKIGDQIAFDMVVTQDDGWIENVKRLAASSAPVEDTNAAPQFRQVRNVEPLSAGDVMTDYPFVTEEGKSIRLSEFKGKAVAFTFIFTRCPFPTFCPRMNSNFEKAAKELAKPGSPTNWHFLSISFDTEVDTPEVLKKYATRLERDPAKWNFVTGEIDEIEAISRQFGLVFMKRPGTIDHNLRTVVVDAAGRVQKVFVGNEWSVEEFVEEMKKAAAVKP